MRRELDERVQQRLDHLLDQWSPQPDFADPVTEEHDDAPALGRWHVLLGTHPARALVTAVLALAIVAGWQWWQGQPRELLAAPAPVEVSVSGGPAAQGAEAVVHVVGSVRSPGLVRLAPGARVADAIEAAGGATAPKSLASVNLARPVVDGEQIVVGSARDGGGAREAPGLSVNRASARQLEDLPGIGPVLAERIVAWREQHGPFATVDALADVPGIGEAILGQIRAQVRV